MPLKLYSGSGRTSIHDGERSTTPLRHQEGMVLTKRTLELEESARYQGLLVSISELLIDGRRHAAKSLNAVLTRTYWSIGQHLVEYEQGGKERAAYGAELLKQLSRTFRLDSAAASLKETLSRCGNSICSGRIRRHCLRIPSGSNPKRFRRHRLRN